MSINVVYTAVLPTKREGMPVAARYETQEEFVPGPWFKIAPTEDVILYIEDVVYDPHKKVFHVELSFIPEEADEDVELAVEEIAEFELGLEALFRLGWMPLMIDELASSENESPVSTTRLH